ncbi:hypothetical protein M426DRAFT_118791 [Hypoxylon sp. CI-4A]|nr:hypothetical protein M426DRAFT_118791 [Hypoxylon sp. CI-4A]
MADPLGAAGSIIGIASFGLKFATTLQTYIEAVADARESLRDVAFDVSATASALDQLHEFIKSDHDGKAVANESGVQQVTRLASQCKKVYTALINLLAKAAGVSKDDNGEVSLDALDLDGSSATSLIQKLKWPFKEPRIKKHQEELRWLKISLLFHLRLMELAKTKMMASTRSSERELALRDMLEKLLNRKEAYAKKIAAERIRERRKEARRRSSARTPPSPKGKARRRSLSLGRRSTFSRSPSPVIREHSPSSSSDDPVQVSELPSSGKAIDLLTYRPPGDSKPPKVKSRPRKYPTMPFQLFRMNSQGALTMNRDSILYAASNSSDKEIARDIEKQEDKSSSEPMEAFQTSSPTKPADGLGVFSQNPVNTQSKPADTSSDQPVTQTNPTSTSNQKDNPSHEYTSVYPKKKHKPTFPRTFRTPPWVSKFIHRRNRSKLMRDYKDQELEAYFIDGDGSPSNPADVRKPPFGHDQLVSMLKHAMKSQKGSVWARYMSLTASQRGLVDRVTREAHHSNPRDRNCVAISLHVAPPRLDSKNEPIQPDTNTDFFIVVFFVLGPPVQPIHLRFDEHNYKFPFELCRTWEDMQDLVQSVMDDRVPFSHQGPYRLGGLDNQTILPEAWSTTVQPGLVVFLELMISRSGYRDRDEDEDEDEDRDSVHSGRGFSSGENQGFEPEFEWVRKKARSLRAEGEEDEDEEEEADIIDFEAEQEMAGLGLGGLLGKWTNVFDSPEEQKEE